MAYEKRNHIFEYRIDRERLQAIVQYSLSAVVPYFGFEVSVGRLNADCSARKTIRVRIGCPSRFAAALDQKKNHNHQDADGHGQDCTVRA